MVEGNNAATLGLDETIFTVTATKNDGSGLPGLNTAGHIRMYYKDNGNGNTITVSSTKKIISIKITFTSESYGAGATVKASDSVVTATDGVYEINANEFSLQNTSTTSQVRVSTIEITYEK